MFFYILKTFEADAKLNLYIFLYTLERDVKFPSSWYTLHIVKIYEGKLSKDFDERNFYAENFHQKLNFFLLIKIF